MKTTLPKPWAEFLTEVDRGLPSPVNLHCFGGFVLTARYELPRTTGDIDYVAAGSPQAREGVEAIGGRESVLAKRYKVCMHYVGVADLPDQYEKRLTQLELDLQKLRLWVLDPYDLLLSKLTRNSPKDREDVKFLAGKLQLEFRVFYARWEEEMKPWVANADRHETTIQFVWREYFPT